MKKEIMDDYEEESGVTSHIIQTEMFFCSEATEV